MRHVVVVFSLLVALTAQARAGRLGEVVKGLNEAAGRDSDNHSEVRDHHGDSSGSSGSSGSGDSGTTCCYAAPDGSYGEAAYYSEPNSSAGPFPFTPHIDLDGGIQAVAGSAAALSGGLRFRFGPVGLAGDVSSYVEGAEDGGSATRLNLWNAGLQLRILKAGGTRAWVELAMSGVSTDGLNMYGLSAAGILEHRITRAIGLTASARAIALEHDVSVTALEIGARLGFVRVGYRTVDFSVGPPLHGPVVGLAFTI